MSVIEWIHAWADRKLHEQTLRRWGMTRQCPWCNQCVEREGNHQIRECDENPFFDTFTCGNCGGESHWEFGPCPIPRGQGRPPRGAWVGTEYEFLRFIATTHKEG